MRDSQNWETFANRLTRLADTEGQDTFLDDAFIFLNEHVLVDSCAVFKVTADKVSGADHVCTFGVLNTSLAEKLAHEYVTSGFKIDPVVQTALPKTVTRVRQLPASQYTQAYRNKYFQFAKLVDKVTSLHRSQNMFILVNFYRLDTNGPFSQDDFQSLESLGPVLGRSVLRHALSKQETLKTQTNYEQLIDQILHDQTQIFSKLTPKERQICALLLHGKHEKEIANSLEITVNTVVTHRRRSYAKLEVSSKSDLFRLFLTASLKT